MEEVITPSNVAVLLKMHVKTVYRLAEEGLIPGNKIGRCWRFVKQDILDLISNKNGNRSRSDKSHRDKKRSHHSR